MKNYDELDKPETTGRYVYGIAEFNDYINLGEIGINRASVYTISYADFCAIVHDCPEEPYQSENEEVVKNWIMEHQRVLDLAQEKFTTVIPLGFDNIIKCKNETESPEMAVQNWLKEDLPRITEMIEKIRGKDEYVIHISCDSNKIIEALLQQSDNIKKMQEEINSKPSGLAYIYKKKLDTLIKTESETLANTWFQELYAQIEAYAEEIIIDKNKRTTKEKIMILSVSGLVERDKLEALGDVLEEINNREGFSIHFSGPWPPYSFVDKVGTIADDRLRK
ncbi:MAG: GvpL/GvpF family gas vesicle protein [Syntrophomonas sp.]|nr:GvpL/GvpF family gas vesicle protein [Syntrophomonas sp.]